MMLAARPGALAFDTGDHVEARIAVAIAGGALGAQIFDREAARGETLAEKPRAGLVGVARRIDRRNTDQRGG